MKIVLVLGYSGVGKSTLGRYSQEEKGWMHVELDLASQGKVAIPGFQPPKDWLFSEEYFDRIREAAKTYGRQGAFITFPSDRVVNHDVGNKLFRTGVSTVYLMAPPRFCLQQFLKRERKMQRHLTEDHWKRNNYRIDRFLHSPPRVSAIRFVEVTYGSRRHDLKHIYNSVVEQI